jgi:Holliday junction resolvase RusA-like endonuclease
MVYHIIKERNIQMIEFDIDPIAKPRMTSSDRWQKREVVQRYYAFKDELRLLARQKNYKIGNRLDISFILPIPKSKSEKEKEKLDSTPHLQKPDLDNLIKAFLDALLENDSKIWLIHAYKLWGKKGKIIIFDDLK